MGFYIVRPNFRGKGYGMKLFQNAWKYLGDRNKGADGVIENLKIYSRVGLKLAHYNARYKTRGTNTKTLGENVIGLNKVVFKKVYDYDKKVFGFKREKFLKAWISQPKSFTYGFVKNKKLLGYGVLSKCFEGYKIGPLFADSDTVANELFDSLIGNINKKEPIFFDIPEVNKGALKIVKKYKMNKVFATGRIYTKSQPKFPLHKWYGITSFELG